MYVYEPDTVTTLLLPMLVVAFASVCLTTLEYETPTPDNDPVPDNLFSGSVAALTVMIKEEAIIVATNVAVIFLKSLVILIYLQL